MSIYRGLRVRKGNKWVYNVVADTYYEIQAAAQVYGTRVSGNRHDGFHLEVTDRQRLRGISLESDVLRPNSREDPFNSRKDKQGGSAGDQTGMVGTHVVPRFRGGVPDTSGIPSGTTYTEVDVWTTTRR